MQLYIIRRPSAWADVPQLQKTGEVSAKVGDDMPDRIRWIRSYVVKEADGRIGTFCVYEAADGDAIQEHAALVGMPGSEFYPVVDTVIIRPDPAKAA